MASGPWAGAFLTRPLVKAVRADLVWSGLGWRYCIQVVEVGLYGEKKRF